MLQSDYDEQGLVGTGGDLRLETLKRRQIFVRRFFSIFLFWKNKFFCDKKEHIELNKIEEFFCFPSIDGFMFLSFIRSSNPDSHQQGNRAIYQRLWNAFIFPKNIQI